MNTKDTILSVLLLLALGGMIYEARLASASRLRLAQSQLDLEHLSQERDHLARELSTMPEPNRGVVASRVEAPKAASAPARAQADAAEPKGAFQAYSDNETEGLARSWADAAARLKERFEETPAARIPEMQFLNAADWLDAARKADLESEPGFRKAMGDVRKRAEGLFTEQFQAALGAYRSANDGQWPADLDHLKTYFNPPVDEAILQRWQIVPSSNFSGRSFAGDWVLTEKAPVDPEFDSQWTIDSQSSGGVGPYQSHPSPMMTEMLALKKTLDPAIDAYKAANHGNEPSEPYQLRPYATDPGQAAALQRVIQISATNRSNH